ncbi:Protein SCO1-like protein 1 [Diplonema papillatum]|nr:Protein SCO1-like protein 1 [Diplonema papillatum]
MMLGQRTWKLLRQARVQRVHGGSCATTCSFREASVQQRRGKKTAGFGAPDSGSSSAKTESPPQAKGGKGAPASELEQYEMEQNAKHEKEEQAADRELVLKWLQLGLIGLLAPLAAWYTFSQQMAKREAGFKVSEFKTVGKAAVGGNWTLVDMDGVPRTRADFYGKWPVMYFGFTHCPEICPVELHRLGVVLDELRKRFPSRDLTPLFVSCDPLRDSGREVRSYLSEFHKDFVGLVGTPEQVADICKSHRIYYSKPTNLEAQEGDYLIDHSIAIYFFDDQFEFVEAFGPRWNADEIIDKMTRIFNE